MPKISKGGFLYRKIGILILKLLNYNEIQNTDGTYHIILNLFDFLLSIAYMFISFWKIGTVTILVLMVNLITLFKLIVKDLKSSLNLRNEYAKTYNNKPGLQYKSPYDFKLMIEFLLIIFIFVSDLIRGGINNYTAQNLTSWIIILSFVDQTINILSDLFEAKVLLKQL